MRRNTASHMLTTSRRPMYVGALAAVTLLVGCAGAQTPRSASPVTLQFELSELPGPGLCRVIGGPNRSCRGIAYVAPIASQVLYRPRDATNLVALCYMDRAEQGVVYGVDLFDVYHRWLVEALLTARDEPVPGDCNTVVDRLRLDSR